MVKLPDVVGLVMCEQFKVDPTTHRVSLDGLFSSLRFRVFPSRPISVTAYAALFDGRGEGEMRLTCTRLETEEELFYHSRWCSFSMHGMMVHFTMTIRKLRFPAPGRYAFTLSFDGNLLTTSFIDVGRFQHASS